MMKLNFNDFFLKCWFSAESACSLTVALKVANSKAHVSFQGENVISKGLVISKFLKYYKMT